MHSQASSQFQKHKLESAFVHIKSLLSSCAFLRSKDQPIAYCIYPQSQWISLIPLLLLFLDHSFTPSFQFQCLFRASSSLAWLGLEETQGYVSTNQARPQFQRG